VHVPIEAKPDMVPKYRARIRKDDPQNDPVYAAMIESLDTNVGRIMRTLGELKLDGDTVVVFTSDNGGLSAPEWKLVPVTSNAPLREGKGHVYEGGIRVPYIVRWPGVKPRVDDTPVCGVDFLPTFCEAAGIRPPTVDGASILPLITRRQPLGPRELYWHYPHYSNQQGKPGGAVRQGDFKLVELYEDNTLELYNLKDDVSERNNLSGSMPEKTRDLHARLVAWRQSIPGIQMPSPNPDYDPAKAGQGYWWQTGTLPK
jgi:arylsulfatase A-like enzyme